MKKSIKLIFVEKNEAQISSFAVGKKKLQALEKNAFRKKILRTYLCRYDFQNGVGNFFEVNGSRDI